MPLRTWLLCLLAVPSVACAAGPGVFVEEMTWQEVRDAIASGKTRAIYYAGSTEQNGPHMVTGKHNAVARHVARRIAEELGNALVFPVMPFAPTGDAEKKTDHMRFPGSVSVSEATFGAVAREVASSALSAGFTYVLLMGDHGGGQDTLKRVAAELDRAWAPRGRRVLYVPDLYFKSEQMARNYLLERGLDAGAHASVHDTSELMFVDGEGVRRERLAKGEPASGVSGDPRKASADLGKALVQFKVTSAVAQIRNLTRDRRR
jgi:creatinine amidohydrolase